jgi:hypothetical protein
MNLDFYTNVERSIWLKLKAEFTANNWSYAILNQLVSKIDLSAQNLKTAVSIIKAGDIPNSSNGGGAGSHLDEMVYVNSQPVVYNRQEWPTSYDLLYQFHILADYDSLTDLRNIETAIRCAFPTPPRPNKIPLYNTTVSPAVLLKDYMLVTPAGYINRDVPEDQLYWRLMILRFECKMRLASTAHNVDFIQQIGVTLETQNSDETNVEDQIFTLPLS